MDPRWRRSLKFAVFAATAAFGLLAFPSTVFGVFKARGQWGLLALAIMDAVTAVGVVAAGAAGFWWSYHRDDPPRP